MVNLLSSSASQTFKLVARRAASHTPRAARSILKFFSPQKLFLNTAFILPDINRPTIQKTPLAPMPETTPIANIPKYSVIISLNA
jgi:hypothetical protein